MTAEGEEGEKEAGEKQGEEKEEEEKEEERGGEKGEELNQPAPFLSPQFGHLHPCNLGKIRIVARKKKKQKQNS